ncbi:hypothetical protein ABMA28_009956 [Loxostege sticticalis]|uniref:Swi5-dependent recombination DNA repair protein 1 homolog n=1 Tax=Loxostege sticticalis TaxID=481309 RepID=A0ABD0SBZ2_LOXSC
MKNVSTLKPQGKIDSPKTPGGISKSLLTPCRRVGLSRNWRKSGPSPFISPLAGSSEVKVEKSEPRKRKKRDDEEETTADSPNTPVTRVIDTEVEDSDLTKESASNMEDIETTPSSNVSTPRRKKSKTLLSARIANKDICDAESPKPINDTVIVEKNYSTDVTSHVKLIEECKEDIKDVVTPVRSKSKTKVSRKKPVKNECIEVKENIGYINENLTTAVPTPNVGTEKKSPENLTKECIVVIQKKIFKKDIKSSDKDQTVKDKKTNPGSQAMFDSDSDDVPLIALNKNEVKVENSKPVIVLDDDDDFDDTCKVKVKKLVDKTTSIGGLRTETNNKKKCKEKLKMLPQKSKAKAVEPKVCYESKPSSQSSLDDDDFVIDNRKTILIRKSYDKVIKPSKAKSTGSITQKDIDELKARIEMKKKILLAKAVSEDTQELRDLIKKWQKGCQDALMELMELMKNKFPDKQNMDYSEILQTLKIPSSLVGYDEDNDCFNTPTDESIILSKFNS